MRKLVGIVPYGALACFSVLAGAACDQTSTPADSGDGHTVDAGENSDSTSIDGETLDSKGSDAAKASRGSDTGRGTADVGYIGDVADVQWQWTKPNVLASSNVSTLGTSLPPLPQCATTTNCFELEFDLPNVWVFDVGSIGKGYLVVGLDETKMGNPRGWVAIVDCAGKAAWTHSEPTQRSSYQAVVALGSTAVLVSSWRSAATQAPPVTLLEQYSADKGITGRVRLDAPGIDKFFPTDALPLPAGIAVVGQYHSQVAPGLFFDKMGAVVSLDSSLKVNWVGWDVAFEFFVSAVSLPSGQVVVLGVRDPSMQSGITAFSSAGKHLWTVNEKQFIPSSDMSDFDIRTLLAANGHVELLAGAVFSELIGPNPYSHLVVWTGTVSASGAVMDSAGLPDPATWNTPALDKFPLESTRSAAAPSEYAYVAQAWARDTHKPAEQGSSFIEARNVMSTADGKKTQVRRWWRGTGASRLQYIVPTPDAGYFAGGEARTSPSAPPRPWVVKVASSLPSSCTSVVAQL